MNSRKLVIVVAVAENGVIGRNGGMPWRIPSDLKHFKTITMGKPVVMGRKTFESIGRPLPGRTNIVLTRDRNWRADGALTGQSLEEVLRLANEGAARSGTGEFAIIGGSTLFEKTLPMAARIELTEVHARPEGDVFFPEFDRSEWRETRREGPIQDEKDEYPYSVMTLERK